MIKLCITFLTIAKLKIIIKYYFLSCAKAWQKIIFMLAEKKIYFLKTQIEFVAFVTGQ